MKTIDSPYASEGRLADVIAAIQTLGIYKFYKLPFEDWADRITGVKASASHWKAVFEQHPEFFRLDSRQERASLVWRRQHQKLFDVDLNQQISRAEYLQFDETRKTRISRTPLTTAEITALIETAILLHTQALERRRDRRWWVDPLLGAVGAVIGLVGALIGAALS